MKVNLTLEKVLKIVEGTCSFSRNRSPIDSNFLIKNIRSLENATPQDLAIIIDRGEASVFDRIDLDKIKNSTAGLFLASNIDVQDKNYILVKDSISAFQKLILYLTKQSTFLTKTIDSTSSIDPTSTISDGAEIGPGTIIGAQVFIGKSCKIGAGVLIHPGVKILDRCIIGDGSIIHSGAVIGSDGFGYQVTHNGLYKIPHIGIVRIGRQVEIGANCTVDRAVFDETIIDDGVKIDNCVHIAHNVKIGLGTAILAQTGIAGGAKIGKGCQIGGQVAIKNDITIGNGVKIVSKSGVMTDLDDGAVVCGIPAMPFTRWKRISVLQSNLPELTKFIKQVPTFVKNKNQNSLFKNLWRNLFNKG